MIATYDFKTQLAFSRGVRESVDIDTIRKMIDGCQSVIKTNEQDDRAGIDYIAKLRRGADILIDAKARAGEIKKYWKNGPEVALETWSVIPSSSCPLGKAGWTLSEQKQTDLILFTFDPVDTNECFLVSFQLLRMAFRRNVEQWKKTYKVQPQSSGAWQSECVFVPYVVVEQALMQVQRGYICDVTQVPEYSGIYSSMRMN